MTELLKNKCLIHIIYTFILIIFSTPCFSDNDYTPEQLRSMYLDAEHALRNNKRKQYSILLKKLRNYPLYPYLRYKDIQIRFNRIKHNEITAFIDAFSDSPLSVRLGNKWLLSLAKRKSWKYFLEYYQDTRLKTLQCYRFQALIKTSRIKQAAENIDRLWLTGNSLPKSCDPVIAYWNQNKFLTPDLVWKRISLAMKSGKLRFAAYLARFLPEKDRKWVDLWRKIHRKPSALMKIKKLREKNKITRMIVLHGLKRLIRKDPDRIAGSYEKINRLFQFTNQEQAELTKKIALKLAWNNKASAQDWLEKIKTKNHDKQTIEWRIRLALISSDWKSVILWIDKLKPEEKSSNQWRYWQARALEASGNKEKAYAIYSSLAEKRMGKTPTPLKKRMPVITPLSKAQSDLIPIHQTKNPDKPSVLSLQNRHFTQVIATGALE